MLFPTHRGAAISKKYNFLHFLKFGNKHTKKLPSQKISANLWVILTEKREYFNISIISIWKPAHRGAVI